MSHEPRMTFVLVHGAWHGGWCWCRVADALRARGHAAYTPTLTGLGDRRHLMSADITLDTHIDDVVSVFRTEQLEQVVLCAHSYGGWPVSGAVEQVFPQIAALMYVDAYMPRDGERGLDIASQLSRDGIDLALAQGAVSRPAPTAATLRVNEADQAWVDAMMTPQPIGVSLQRIRLTGARERIGRKAYVRASNYPSPEFDRYLAEARATPGWRTFEVPSGHDVMVDAPGPITDILLSIGAA